MRGEDVKQMNPEIYKFCESWAMDTTAHFLGPSRFRASLLFSEGSFNNLS